MLPPGGLVGLRALGCLGTVVALVAAGGGAAEARELPLLRAGDRGRWTCAAAAAVGPESAVPPPTGWQQAGFDDTGWREGGAGGCDALRMRRRFDAGKDYASLAALTLELKYQDGFVAWLNGAELVRRRLPEGSVLATESHGTDAERIYVPLAPGMLRETGNLLAVEVHPSRTTRSASADVSLLAADAARIVRGPWLQRVLDGGADLLVETDLPTIAEARYGARTMDRVARDAHLDTRHRLHLDHLEPGATYHYRIAVHEPACPDAAVEGDFHTPPLATHPLRFVITGDVRSGHDVHAQLVRAITAEDPDLVLMTGDMVETGTDEAGWQRFFDIEAPLLRQVPVYAAIGNHDKARRSQGLERFLGLFPREAGTSWWSFDVSGVHFVLLDSESYSDRTQLEWLRRDLEAARAAHARAIFAVAHHGPWSSALHGDNNLAIHDYVPLLEQAGAALFIAGHDHDYERGQVGGLAYLVSGGGGAELRPQKCAAPGPGQPAGLRRCGPRVKAFANEHHYVVVEVEGGRLRICPKRPDGTLLESCPVLPLSPTPVEARVGPRDAVP